MMCVTTRFRLKYAWDLPRLYLIYRGMRRDLAAAPGLLRFAFLVESPVACCTLSVWESEAALNAFANVASHLRAVRFAKRVCRQIWSAYWHFDAMSKHADEWPGRVPWPALRSHPIHPGRLVMNHAEVAQ